MGSKGGVREAITGNDGGVVGNGILGHPGQVGVRVVDIEKAESFGKASGPFEVVHQRPGGVTADIHVV